MSNDQQEVMAAATHLKAYIDTTPAFGLMTGTGLGASAAGIDIVESFPYEKIPHFPTSTVESHLGRLIVGRMKGKMIIALQGRFHLYEGYSAKAVTFPIRVLQALGVKNLILTNAAGGLNSEFQTGDIMVIRDHINLTGANPLIGPNEADWGVRFPDMTAAYDRKLSECADRTGTALHFRMRKGVYASLRGPSLETPAEVRFLKMIGADAVGFSTVQEVIAAVHAGIRVLGLSIITNINDPDRPMTATVEEIIAVAEKASPILNKIIRNVMEKIDDIEKC